MSEARRHALVCTPGFPDSERQSGLRRVANLIELMREADWDVTLVSEHPGRPADRRRLEQIGVAAFDEGDLEGVLRGGRFTIALVAFWRTAERLIPVIRERSPETRIVIDSIDLHLVRQARERFQRPPTERWVFDEVFGSEVARELNAYAQADAVLTVSETEAALLSQLSNGCLQVLCVSDCEDPAKFSEAGEEEREGIVYLANFQHPPNRDGAEYLIREILPRVPERVLTEHPVSVVGNALAEETLALCERAEHVTPVGWVPSVVPYLASARVSVAPLRYGAGTKRKMIQALMLGTPSVATSVAVEGFDVSEGEGIVIADAPQEFAEALTSLLEDSALWQRLREGGRGVIAAGHSREVVAGRLAAALDAILEAPAESPRRRPSAAESAPPRAEVTNGHSRPRRASEPGNVAEVEGPRRPIFVVGSPRSGTSILTWSIGQHPNILPVEESDWLAKLAVNLFTAHALGSARGERSQLSAMGIQRDEFLRCFGDAAFDLILHHKRRYAERIASESTAESPGTEFQVMRSPDEPKRRWVDGTPEYSHHIFALLRMFPGAKFIHILRDPQDVALSLVNFHELSGQNWSWDRAYGKWMAHVRSCVAAEQTLGPETVLRIRHRDLRDDPEATIRTCLEFAGEEFSPACLGPLTNRINSSNVEERERQLAARTVDKNLEREALALGATLVDGEGGATDGEQPRSDELERTLYARIVSLERMFADHAGGIAQGSYADRAQVEEQRL